MSKARCNFLFIFFYFFRVFTIVIKFLCLETTWYLNRVYLFFKIFIKTYLVRLGWLCELIVALLLVFVVNCSMGFVSIKVVNSVSVGVLFYQLEWNVSVLECFAVPFEGYTIHIYIYICIYIYIYIQQI